MTGATSENARRAGRRDEPTMAAIARLAGVSPPTVSRVLNGRSGVAPSTRQQVEALLRKHGYLHPGPAAPARSVEIVFYGLQSNMAVAIMRGVERVARPRRLAVGFTDVHSPASAEYPWPEHVLARRPAGVIAAYSYFTPDEYAPLTLGGIPVVALDPSGIPPDPIPSVGATNWNGGVAVTRHLLELGHRRIAVISGPTRSLIARARLDACRAVMDAAGVPLDEHLVRNGRFSFEDGIGYGSELLAVADRPTAIICGNDLQALGVYEAARRARLTVPGDLSVVGFDDLEIATWCGPPLTTVRQPFEEMGAAAAAMVLALAAGQRADPHRVEVLTTMVIRDSTAAPPAHL